MAIGVRLGTVQKLQVLLSACGRSKQVVSSPY
jgi:hypothetical protein